ncbi:glutamate--cysteine ligase [Microbacterium sp.]|uniref:carboxylate-amine ligase n=1 Tax=Microbacterium sp. TaxID=51671 RepID=UPI002811ACBD|nr:glutamate--cysteine ligase [Microbacterium sp.]
MSAIAVARGAVGVTRSRRIRTVGVEEELLLVDAASLLPTPAADAVMRRQAEAEKEGGSIMAWEAKLEQIEVVGPPLRTLAQLRSSIVSGRRAADAAARAVGARAVPLATAPAVCDTHTVADERYDAMRKRFGRTMREQLTCGFHVHVGVDSREEGVAVLDRIRPWLPVLLALSANSPFYQGEDSGFASYRYQAYSRWPTSGPYDVFGSADAYAEHLARMLDTGVLLDPGMVYFDARLSHHLPTVEIRIADVCLRAEDAAALAVMVRALVNVAADAAAAARPVDATPTTLLQLASWRASRFGLDDHLVHPHSGSLQTAADVVRAFRSHIHDGFADDEERAAVDSALAAILARGTGARTQREAVAGTGDLRDAVAVALTTHEERTSSSPAPGTSTSSRS